jgi:hypothetical protein
MTDLSDYLNIDKSETHDWPLWLSNIDKSDTHDFTYLIFFNTFSKIY